VKAWPKTDIQPSKADPTRKNRTNRAAKRPII
jgi:hypothetical protein